MNGRRLYLKKLCLKIKLMFSNFGSTVRIKETEETADLALAGKEGEIYGETVPSSSGVEVIGQPKRDFAINVHFHDLGESFWFDEDLVEIVDQNIGADMTLGDVRYVKASAGEWVPETEQDHDAHDKLAEEQIISDVKQYGWHVGLIEAEDGEPSFAYTIGLWETYKHPEIIAFGLSINNLHAILNNAGGKVKSGQVLKTDQDDFDIFEALPAQFLKVDPKYLKKYFGYGLWYNKHEDFPALQLVWSDRKGVFPWDPEFEREFIGRQPILNDLNQEHSNKWWQFWKK